MSRIEDDRDAARLAARLMEAKRADEQKKAERTTADSAFRKLVHKGQAEQTQKAQDSLGRSAIAHMLEKEQAEGAAEGSIHDPSLGEKDQARSAESRAHNRTGEKAFNEKLKQANTSEGQ
ncbi:MAG: hypothetical protein ACYC8T_33955, partial [Myxococcaceae bacterium]